MAKVQLFDFLKIIFAKDGRYEELSSQDKIQHAFMINRFFCRKFPITAQQLNFNGMHPLAIVELRRQVALRYTGTVPGWIFAKTKQKETEKSWQPNEQVAKFYMERFRLSKRDLDDLIKFNPAEIKASFAKLEKQI